MGIIFTIVLLQITAAKAAVDSCSGSQCPVDPCVQSQIENAVYTTSCPGGGSFQCLDNPTDTKGICNTGEDLRLTWDCSSVHSDIPYITWHCNSNTDTSLYCNTYNFQCFDVQTINNMDNTLNQPISGYLDSGYYAYKALIWHGIRHVPGSIWLYVPIFINACLTSIFIFVGSKIGDENMTIYYNNMIMAIRTSLSSSDRNKYYNSMVITIFKLLPANGIKEYYNFLVTVMVTALSISIAYISLAVISVEDLLITFAVVASSIQMISDLLRLTVDTNNINVITSGLNAAVVAGIVLGLLDRTHIVDIIYVIYVTLSTASILLICLITFLKRGIRVIIISSSTVGMAATLTTNVLVLENILANKAPIIVAFVFTGINYIITILAISGMDFHEEEMTNASSSRLTSNIDGRSHGVELAQRQQEITD